MRFSLIVCTYMRPEPLLKLLNSVKTQTHYPPEILIIDASHNKETENMLKEEIFENLKYYMVLNQHRGLTKQRNYGINLVSKTSEIICFLDDDIVLEPNYFEELLKTYNKHPEALAVGGYIKNNTKWEKVTSNYKPLINEFAFDSYKRKDGSRFILRKKLGLDSNELPGFLPDFSHGRSVGFLPPSGEIYEVEQIMGGASSFRKNIFESMRFSEYFVGYGLYEDVDFSLRLAKKGKLYVNTKAQLFHYHDASGRPNKYKYGKMVIRNGWYVWRIKYPRPDFKAKVKWNVTSFLLTCIRFTNVLNTNKKQEAFTESIGRCAGWLSLIFNKPKIQS